MSENMKFVINGKNIDLSNVGAIKIRDWCNMTDQGLNYKQLEDPRNQSKFILYIVNKNNPDVTIDDILDLDPIQFRDIALAVQAATVVKRDVEPPLENGPNS